jgi:hypothetical protein
MITTLAPYSVNARFDFREVIAKQTRFTSKRTDFEILKIARADRFLNSFKSTLQAVARKLKIEKDYLRLRRFEAEKVDSIRDAVRDIKQQPGFNGLRTAARAQ